MFKVAVKEKSLITKKNHSPPPPRIRWSAPYNSFSYRSSAFNKIDDIIVLFCEQMKKKNNVSPSYF